MDYPFDYKNHVLDHIVIGAGLAGAFCAGKISLMGGSVLLMDKARGTGGRLSSKRLAYEHGHIAFDLGAQSFEVSHDDLREYVAQRSDLVVSTSNKVHGLSRNSLIARGAIESADTGFGWRVRSARFNEGVWSVVLFKGKEQCTLNALNLVLATPPKQAAEILGEAHTFYSRLDAVEHEAQWVCMVAFTAGAHCVDKVSDVARTIEEESDIIRTLVFDQDKEGRTANKDLEVIVMHASATWTLEHLDLPKEQVEQALLSELARLTGERQEHVHADLVASHTHRWLYARPILDQRIDGAYLSLPSERLLICGDYFNVDSRYGVESAFLSAKSMLESEILRTETSESLSLS